MKLIMKNIIFLLISMNVYHNHISKAVVMNTKNSFIPVEKLLESEEYDFYLKF